MSEMTDKKLTPWWVAEGLGKYAMTDELLALIDENTALRARVAKLEAALRLLRRYAEEHDNEFVPFVVDEALAALEDAPK